MRKILVAWLLALSVLCLPATASTSVSLEAYSSSVTVEAAQNTEDLGEWGSITYYDHAVPNIERIVGLIDLMWEYVSSICEENAPPEFLDQCIPNKPDRIDIYILPYKQFMDTWIEGKPKEEDYKAVIVDRTVLLYGYTGTSRDGNSFKIYFSQVPIDYRLAHEITHVMEIMRREFPNEERTRGRHTMFLTSQVYIDWLETNY